MTDLTCQEMLIGDIYKQLKLLTNELRQLNNTQLAIHIMKYPNKFDSNDMAFARTHIDYIAADDTYDMPEAS